MTPCRSRRHAWSYALMVKPTPAFFAISSGFPQARTWPGFIRGLSVRNEFPIAFDQGRARRTLPTLQVRDIRGADLEPRTHLPLSHIGFYSQALKFSRRGDDSRSAVRTMR